jgi:hypothetical protein
MGFPDFLGRQGGHRAAAGSGFQALEVPEGRITRHVHRLLEVPVQERNAAWTGQFLARAGEAAFFLRVPAIVQGAEPFPYFALYSTPGDQPYPGHVIHHMKDDYLLDQGLGVVINPRGEEADWAFSYGDILHYHLYGAFYPPLPGGTAPAGWPDLTPQARLPQVARSVLRTFLGRLGVADPRVRTATWDHAGPGSLELLFAFSPRDFRSLEDFQFAMNNLSWFLPRNYSYSVAGNQARAEGAFEPL